MTEKKEYRKFELRDFSVTREEEKAPKIVGYAAMYNSETVVAGLFREVIKPGAFTRTVEEKHDVRALVDHDPSKILGRTKAGTLKLAEDKTGLKVEIDPPDTSIGRDIVQSLERGDVDQMSFGFYIRDQEWVDDDEAKLPLREIRDVDTFDVSIVTYPQYEDTKVSLRTEEVAKEVFEEHVAELKSLGEKVEEEEEEKEEEKEEDKKEEQEKPDPKVQAACRMRELQLKELENGL